MVVHSDKLRWLFWLRWRLFLRSFTRDKARIITSIIYIVIFLPLFGAVAVGTYFAYRYLPTPANSEVLFLVLAAVYLLWIVLPLLEFTVNEGLDVSKLVQFPVTRLEIMLSLLFSTLLDIPMVALLFLLIAVVVGWAVSIPVILFTIVAMLVFYVQVVGISQLVLALLMRTLQSRRFRDLSIVLIAIFTSSCYLVQQVVLHGIGTSNFVSNLQHAGISGYLQWSPPGMTARAVQQAVAGNFGFGAIWLLGALITAVVVLYLWQLVLERSLSTPEVGGKVRTRRRKANGEVAGTSTPSQRAVAAVSGGSVQRSLGMEQTLAMTRKEFVYFWRDPQLKALFFQSLVYILVFTIGPIFGTGARNDYSASLFIAPLAVFFSIFVLSYNTLGMERDSLTTLFLFPIEPRLILMGKNLAVALIGVIELILLMFLGAFLSHNWVYILPLLTIGLAGIAIVLGCSNFSSVFFPTRMRQMQRGFRATGSSTGNAGCMRGIMSLAMMAVTAILLIPAALGLALPIFLNAEWAWVITIPASLIYGVAFYLIVTRVVAARMLDREPDILLVTTRE
jgi:ABC-2 type transport system permease protein